MAPNSPLCSFIHASIAGSRSTVPLKRSKSVLIVAPFSPSDLCYVAPYTRNASHEPRWRRRNYDAIRTYSTLSAMADRPSPVFRTIEEVSLIGTMAIYSSQAEASQGIPQQWRAFRLAHPALESSSKFLGASPCTGDRKIRYITGVAYEGPDGVVD